LYRNPHKARRYENHGEDQIMPSESSPTPARPDHMTKRKSLHPEHQYSFSFFLPRPPDPDSILQEDVIDQGLISLEEAEECFVRFTEVMLPHFPVVAFPPGITAS